MAAHVVVVLDTTAPTIDVAAEVGMASLVTLGLSTDDATEVLIWGAIDPTDPGNAYFGETEGGATWIEYDDEIQLRAHPDGGYIFVRVRDEVWNESEPFRVTIGTPPEPPVPPVTTPVPYGPPSRSQVFRSRSTVRVRSLWRGGDVAPHEGRSRVRIQSKTAVARSLRRASVVQVRLDDRRRASQLTVTELGVRSASEVERRSEGPGTEAALLELDIL